MRTRVPAGSSGGSSADLSGTVTCTGWRLIIATPLVSLSPCGRTLDQHRPRQHRARSPRAAAASAGATGTLTHLPTSPLVLRLVPARMGGEARVCRRWREYGVRERIGESDMGRRCDVDKIS
ncbi:MAG: hypothetical protein M1522_04750, partial [Actinobacteria bacterium]|nr:hypothetical protein [Actinomycetota bacterium]